MSCSLEWRFPFGAAVRKGTGQSRGSRSAADSEGARCKPLRLKSGLLDFPCPSALILDSFDR